MLGVRRGDGRWAMRVCVCEVWRAWTASNATPRPAAVPRPDQTPSASPTRTRHLPQYSDRRNQRGRFTQLALRQSCPFSYPPISGLRTRSSSPRRPRLPSSSPSQAPSKPTHPLRTALERLERRGTQAL